MANASKPAANKPKAASKQSTFSAEELDAIKEAKAERKKGSKGDGEADVLAKIAEMDPADRKLAEAIHAIVKANAPALTSKTWYGMPAYANADGKIICFFQNAGKFKARYSTLGFNDAANLDDGNIWPSAFALTSLNAEDEKRIAALIRQAAS